MNKNSNRNNKNQKSRVDKNQSLSIAALQRKVAQLKRLSGMPKKAARKVQKQGRLASAKAVSDPIVIATKAKLNPFECPKGSAAPLTDARPSQKFTARATGTITLPDGCTAVFMQTPCVASDAKRLSVVVALQSAAATPLSGLWKNGVAGDLVCGGGTLRGLSSNTPYSALTLNGVNGYEWALCGSGLRVTYEGAKLYQGGVVKYMYDTQAKLNEVGGYTSVNIQDIVALLDSSPDCIVNSLSIKPTLEINATCVEQYNSTITYCPRGSMELVGGSSGTYYFGLNPGIIGYITNSTGASATYRLDTVEHWSVCSPTIQALHTDSAAHPVLSDQVYSLLHSSRQRHAQNPHSETIDMLKTTKKAMGSPLGHEVLNAAVAAALA